MSQMPNGSCITDDHVEALEADGVVPLRKVADAMWVERLRAAVERTLNSTKSDDMNAYFKRLRVWETDQDMKDFVYNSPIAAIAARLMNTNSVNMLYDQVFVKEPGTESRTPWHHDLTYWPIRGSQVITIWIALDPVTLENGGMEFIRGSHKLSTRYRPYDTDSAGHIADYFYGDDDDEYVELPDFEAERHKYEFLSWNLEPGDALAFHALTVHGGGSNTHQALRRRAYAVRLAGPAVRYYDGKVWNKYITNPELKAGDRLTSAQYPILYQEQQASPE